MRYSIVSVKRWKDENDDGDAGDVREENSEKRIVRRE